MKSCSPSSTIASDFIDCTLHLYSASENKLRNSDPLVRVQLCLAVMKMAVVYTDAVPRRAAFMVPSFDATSAGCFCTDCSAAISLPSCV